MNKSDHDLFCKLCAPTHALNHLLPPARSRASLRTRGHSYRRKYSTDLHKKSFLFRCLYSFVKWNSFWFCCFVLYVILFLCLLFDVRLSHLINVTYTSAYGARPVLVSRLEEYGDDVRRCRCTLCYRRICRQEAQLSPSDRAMRLVSSNLANCHTTVQKLLIRQVLTKLMV